MSLEQLLNLIGEIAEIPSFSSFEEVIHPYIFEKTEPIPGIKVHRVHDNNLVLEIPGTPKAKPIALSAHLDKINHFGENPPDTLPFRQTSDYLEGQMDDSVGLGICLALALQSRFEYFPPLLVLLSEMEEGFGLRKHPHLLKNKGKGYHHGIGAERISEFLVKEDKLPAAVITVDTTPLFKGEPGMVLYSEHWQFTKTTPSEGEKSVTKNLVDKLLRVDPNITLFNNTNDYLTYGKYLNTPAGPPVPSVAIEPAIFPYHQKNERVFVDDIQKVYANLKSFLINEGE
ncbi:MAG: hypothetical protein WEB89_11150 [Balneolales bacterium]